MAIDLKDSGEGEEIIASINTTPLVDVMLVLLIIFLITIPVVVHTHQVVLPKETTTREIIAPQDINLAITKTGSLYWQDQRIDVKALGIKLKTIDGKTVHILIRADANTPYHFIAPILHQCHEAGINTIEFITEPVHSSS
ncbi:MAG: biopolymer transporter ExbD [Ferrovum sp. 37-45-19]|jgi:biopolymer transport protein ExbD|uniref:ExbD/TolR family protein n=1 Tax=Ferrovum sp. JA12 TaxID=1356299 RepID=UPI0007024E18|nr:biopolymer transporter ExbD [Ferrovum sp. JA12]OYV79177.1 MAG: biopolymer transporter ExbD [Ferrovum sp. 21-44-67]OYV93538.1 MAG: biopolymer transporter ExbD [Ferrovum sp. 37-45-19]OZB33323.1 MAG: biopolymer transporter ExbD [Ferrovum sp. 34-44-207]HQT81792.1 biopolymer transporter ExbD [Ferrovaceae bacterium]KRH79620.1 biopolymer transport protein ExbD [Ferrovum sp. JA12]